MAELSQKELERMVVGEQPPERVTFYEKAVLDVDRSTREGRRVYNKILFVKKTAPGTTDWASHIAKRADIEAHRAEYEYFLNHKQGVRVPGIEIIPNLDVIHLQELIDMGLQTIPALAAATIVPPYLEYARQMAIALNNALKEAQYGQQGQGTADRGAGSTPAGTDRRETGALHALDRQDHSPDVERHVEAPRVGGGAGEPAARPRQAGPVNGGPGNLIDNWSISHTVRMPM